MVSNDTTAPLWSDLERATTVRKKSNGIELQVVHLAIGFVQNGRLKLKYIWIHRQWQVAWLLSDLEEEKLEDLR